MTESVNGEIRVKVIGETGDEGKESTKPTEAKTEEKKNVEQMSGMLKILNGIGKTMKKINPVFDVSNIIIYLIRKSAVIMGILDPVLDILGAVVDVILKSLFPVLVPVLKIMAASIPAIEVASKVIEGFLSPIAKALEWIAKLVQDGAAIIKKWTGGGGGETAKNIGVKVAKSSIVPLMAYEGIKTGWNKLSEHFPGGSRYIPTDMTAQLHRGESVLTARETQRNKAGGGITIQNPQFSITAGGTSTMDAKAFANTLYKEFTKKLTDDARRS
jgi:hypothetical protein